ncbi:MAG: hypothetical protein H6709_16635 [Kofleriaceae bacterium]|nr:hypothetical protein [Kofleriaceae bacterium]
MTNAAARSRVRSSLLLRLAGVGLALALVPGALAGCGNDGGGDDVATIDARVPDAAPPDAAVDRCQVLCDCTASFCAQDMTECLATCATIDDSVRECRITHCGFAQTNPSFHCPHALGDSTAPGVPAECIPQ